MLPFPQFFEKIVTKMFSTDKNSQYSNIAKKSYLLQYSIANHVQFLSFLVKERQGRKEDSV